MLYSNAIDTKIEISCTPNWALSNYFTHSILPNKNTSRGFVPLGETP